MHCTQVFELLLTESVQMQDHAAGAILVEEAGGIISDGRGEPLDFGLGRTLGENFGVVAAGKDVHAKVIAAIKQAKAEEETQGQL